MHIYFGELDYPPHAEHEPFALLLTDEFDSSDPFIALWKWTTPPEGEPKEVVYAATIDEVTKVDGSSSRITATHEGHYAFQFHFDRPDKQLSLDLKLVNHTATGKAILHPSQHIDTSNAFPSFPVFISEIPADQTRKRDVLVLAVPKGIKDESPVHFLVPTNNLIKQLKPAQSKIENAKQTLNGVQFSFHWEGNNLIGVFGSEGSLTLSIGDTSSDQSLALAECSRVTLNQQTLMMLLSSSTVVPVAEDIGGLLVTTTLINDTEPKEYVRVTIVDSGKEIMEEIIWDLVEMIPFGAITSKTVKYGVKAAQALKRGLGYFKRVPELNAKVDTVLPPGKAVSRPANRLKDHVWINNDVVIERYTIAHGNEITIEVLKKEKAGDGDFSVNKIINDEVWAKNNGWERSKLPVYRTTKSPRRALVWDRMWPGPNTKPLDILPEGISIIGSTYVISRAPGTPFSTTEFYPLSFACLKNQDKGLLFSYNKSKCSYFVIDDTDSDVYQIWKSPRVKYLELLRIEKSRLRTMGDYEGEVLVGEAAPDESTAKIWIDNDLAKTWNSNLAFGYCWHKKGLIYRLNACPETVDPEKEVDAKFRYCLDTCPTTVTYMVINEFVCLPPEQAS